MAGSRIKWSSITKWGSVGGMLNLPLSVECQHLETYEKMHKFPGHCEKSALEILVAILKPKKQ